MSLREDQLKNPSYRRAIGMMLLNDENKIFVGQRYGTQGSAWQMPQGGIGEKETPDQAMIRELQEEIGTCNVEIIVKSKKWYTYDLPPKLAKRLWEGKYKGQKQIWYVLRFQGNDKEINIRTLHPEFRAWKWVEKEELLALIVPFKKDLYTRVLNDLWPYILKSSTEL